jgi:hypothetical protein
LLTTPTPGDAQVAVYNWTSVAEVYSS